jgi:hypothetical protein
MTAFAISKFSNFVVIALKYSFFFGCFNADTKRVCTLVDTLLKRISESDDLLTLFWQNFQSLPLMWSLLACPQPSVRKSFASLVAFLFSKNGDVDELAHLTSIFKYVEQHVTRFDEYFGALHAVAISSQKLCALMVQKKISEFIEQLISVSIVRSAVHQDSPFQNVDLTSALKLLSALQPSVAFIQLLLTASFEFKIFASPTRLQSIVRVLKRASEQNLVEYCIMQNINNNPKIPEYRTLLDLLKTTKS